MNMDTTMRVTPIMTTKPVNDNSGLLNTASRLRACPPGDRGMTMNVSGIWWRSCSDCRNYLPINTRYLPRADKTRKDMVTDVVSQGIQRRDHPTTIKRYEERHLRRLKNCINPILASLLLPPAIHPNSSHCPAQPELLHLSD